MMAPKVSTYNGRPTFANPRYLKQAQSEIPCLYAFPYDQSTHANRLNPNGEETLALERESRSKLNKDSVRPYDYTTLNSLYEIFKPPTQDYETQLAHANEIRRKMWRKSFVKSKSNIYKNVRFLPVSKSISKIRQAYNVRTNNINYFKEIFDNAWIKHSKDQFRALTAQEMEILIQTCLMPLAIKTQNDSFKFVHELKQEMHADLKYVESIEKEIDELESDKAEFSNMYDEILQECVSKNVMCYYLMSLFDLDALAELQCMYLHKVKECDCLAQKLLKQTKYVSKKFGDSTYLSRAFLTQFSNSFGRKNSGDLGGDLIVGGGMGIGEGVAFCLGLRFALEALHFVLEDLTFCLRRSRVLSSEDLAFCLQKILRFVFKDLAFCLQRSYVLFSKILRFALEALCFVFKDLVFCFGSTAFCLLPRSCVLSQKHCVLSLKILRFV
nr:hypothetical protein [Tanacetum cinerariifolium]